jgi:sugar lactone lactonase YvrE
VDAQGNVYVSGGGSNPVKKLAPDGRVLIQWTEGSAPGQFQSPNGIAVLPDGTVYVADAGNHRIQVLH